MTRLVEWFNGVILRLELLSDMREVLGQCVRCERTRSLPRVRLASRVTYDPTASAHHHEQVLRIVFPEAIRNISAWLVI